MPIVIGIELGVDGKVVRHHLTSPQPREVKVRIGGTTSIQRTTTREP